MSAAEGAQLRFIFEDARSVGCTARAGETVHTAARRAGIALESDCLEGACGACKATLSAGQVALQDYLQEALSDEERAEGQTLLCRAMAQGDCVIELPYDSARALRRVPARTLPARLAARREIARNVIEIDLALEAPPFDFLPGQYVNLKVTGSGLARSYSMAHAPRAEGPWTFAIRLLDSGAMSEWLRAAPEGAALEIEGPFGHFYLRAAERPILMVAGGTGLAPMLAMLEALALRHESGEGPVPPTCLLVGAGSPDELFGKDRIEGLRARGLVIDLRLAAMKAPADWSDGHDGPVTELLQAGDVAQACDAYLCGPPGMIDAARGWLTAQGVPAARIHAERFLASGSGAR
jgi:benzoate/toluate 1,2-dioxygenase reductase subunit